MSTILTLLTLIGGGIGVIAGGLEIWRHLRPDARAQILNPLHQAECGSRDLVVSGTIPRRSRRAGYWVAVQPADCRGVGSWWLQGKPLTFDDDGNWSPKRVLLGRGGEEGDKLDVGKWYTIALFEASGYDKALFELAHGGGSLSIRKGVRQLCSIEVKRVRYPAN